MPHKMGKSNPKSGSTFSQIALDRADSPTIAALFPAENDRIPT